MKHSVTVLVLDTDGVTNTYELLIMLDGIAETVEISSASKTIRTQTLMIRPMMPKTTFASYAASDSTRVTAATTSFEGSTNYYLDLVVPYAVMLAANNAPNDTPGRRQPTRCRSNGLKSYSGLFWAPLPSRSTAKVLSESGADLIGSKPHSLSSQFSAQINLDGSDPSSNSAPTLANAESSALSFTEGGSATAITSALTVADSDDTNIESATVQITGNLDNSEDVLAFTTQNGITGTFTSSTGLLTLSGSATLANYQTALRSVTYQNTDTDNPSTSQRTVTFKVNDGDSDSNTQTRTIDVTRVNDAPVLASAETSALSFTEGGSATAITSALTVSDVDDTNIESATVQITSNLDNSEDVLAFTTQNGITGSFTSSTGLLTLSGSATLANYQTALRSVTYQNTDTDNPSTSQRTVTFTVNDGDSDSNTQTRTIDVTRVNDAPVLSSSNTSLSFAMGDAAKVLASTVAVTDVDDTNIESATVQITSNLDNSEDVLAFTNQNGITGSFTAATGLLSLSGSATLANYQTALRSITYQNTDGTSPSTLQRTVTFIVNDGDVNSNSYLHTISVTLVANSAPVLASAETSALSFTEGGSATAITSALTVADSDDTNIESATVQITSNLDSSEDVLAFTTQNGITGSFTSSTGLLTLSGSATLANYQTALRSVTYQNTDTDNPSTSQRTVTFTVNDGDVNSNTQTRTIDVVAVNDAPVLASAETSALSFTEGGSATAITSALTVSDSDDTNIESATVQITSNLDSSEDVLAFTTQNGITGSFTSSTGLLTLSGSATLANYQTALRSVTYQNTDTDNPSTSQRAVTFTVNDGDVNSNNQTRTIDVVAVNDAPVLASAETSALSFTEGGSATAITSALTVSDSDDTNIESATVQITSNLDSSEDVLAFTTQNGITGSFTSSTGLLTLSGSATLADYQTALRSVTYQNTDTSNPSTSQRTVTFTVNDGDVNSNTQTRTIDVVAVNDAPVLASAETSALSFTEGGSATAITSALTVADSDDTNIESATVQITSNLDSSEDVLAFTTQNGITGSFTSSTGLLSLSGSATLANYQTALRSVTYQNTDTDNPSTSQRTVTFTVNDGDVNSNTQTRTIDVTRVNDAPVLASAETSALSFTEGGSATAITSALTVADSDDTNIESATVQITSNLDSSEDVLAFTTQNGITGSVHVFDGSAVAFGQRDAGQLPDGASLCDVSEHGHK